MSHPPLNAFEQFNPAPPRRTKTPIATKATKGGWRLVLLTGLLMMGPMLGCGLTAPNYVVPRYAAETAPGAGTAVQVAAPLDARHFTNANTRGPVPTLRGDAQDSALTARVVGRMPVTMETLGANVELPPEESVSAWVQKALVQGLREAGLDAQPASTGHSGPELQATIVSFWLNVRNSPGPSVVVYRAEIELTGDLQRFREGRTVTATGSVSQIGLNYALFRKSFDAALQAIAQSTAQTAVPGTPLPTN